LTSLTCDTTEPLSSLMKVVNSIPAGHI